MLSKLQLKTKFINGTMRNLLYHRGLLLVLVLWIQSVSCDGVAQDSSSVAAGSGDTPVLLTHLQDNTSPDPSDLEFYRRLYDFDVGKRAYSYVSEYKRLPVYNFGLGKRAGGRMYGFGLGKRAGPDGRKMFSFGLGKRVPDEDDEYYFPEFTSGDEGLADTEESIDKRDRLYSFGLGKRARPYSFGLGKRGGASSLYSFGLGKRADRNLYSFGLGKRADGRLYAFGLGKRPNYDGRMSSSRFNFGLGKRASTELETEDDILDEAKRAPDHRFGFGLGKREIPSKELAAVEKEADDVQQRRHRHDEGDVPQEVPKDGEESTGEKNDNGKHAVKRSLHFDGVELGKEMGPEFDLETDPDFDKDNINEEFARFARRPYSFGLGKRIPMYDFGIGKRADR